MRAFRGIVVLSMVLGLAALAPSATARAWLEPDVVSAHYVVRPSSVQLAADGDGALTAVWISREEVEDEDLVWMATRPAGATAFGAAVALSAPGDYAEARLAVNDIGAAAVVWESYNDTRTAMTMAGVTRSSALADFTEPVDVSPQGFSSRGTAVVVDEAGLATVVYTLFDNTPVGRAWATSATTGTTTWADPTPLSDESFDGEVAAAVDSSGRVTAVWTEVSSGDGRRVETSDRLPGGAWSTAQTLSDGERYNAYPVAAANAAGQAVVAWVGDLESATRVFVAQRAPGAPAFGAPLPAGRVLQSQSDIDVALSPAGTATVVSSDSSDSDAYRVWATRVTAAGATTNEVVSRAPWDYAANPDVAVDAAGAVTVAWESFSVGGDLLTAYRPPGGPFQRAVRVDRTGETVYAPQVATDPSGDVTVLYQAWEGGDDEPESVRSVVLDVAAPAFGSVVVPATAAIGTGISMQASATDRFTGPPRIDWDFGDGAKATGASIGHAWTGAGTYVVTVTATDGAGNTATTTRSVRVQAPADTTAPLVSRARLKPARLPADKAARLRVTVGETADLLGKVSRKKDGRWRKAGAKKQWAVEAGASSLKVYGKRAQHRLKPGRYRIALTATDAAGNSSRTVVVRFTVTD